MTREDETIIPHCKDMIKSGDLVFFVTTPNGVNDLLEKCGKTLFGVKNIMFLGGSRIAQRTIEKLGDQFNIKIIEAKKDRCQKVAEHFSNALVINGDGRNLELLREKGIVKMDAFVAETGNSETNILSLKLAKKMGVKRTVAEIENIDFISLAEQIGIGSVINKKMIAASFIYRYSLSSEVSHLKCLTATEAEAVEFKVKPGAKITTRPVNEIDFPKDAKIGGVVRDNQGFIVKGYTQILKGDKVLVFALPSALKKVDKYFK